jgi:hypothetical protein
MIGIACYFDGEVLQGPNGAYYSHQMPKMFNIRLGLDFRGLNREVYQQLGIDHRNYELVITARINIGQGNQTWFQQLPVQDDSSWELYVQMTMNMTFKFLELYVVANPRQNSRHNSRQQSVTGPSRAPSVAGPSRTPSVAGPSRVQSDRGGSQIPSSSSSRVQSERDRSETPERLYYADNTDDDPEEIEAEANWDDNGDGGVSDHSDEDTGIPVLGRRKWPIVDRGERHPFEQFHDTSGFGEADSSFFATCEVCLLIYIYF